ncbi:MAG: hypothetical protein K0Q89_2986 [Thermomicrobiales bacterium]|nr:hypothetical protein [Thermomicrobiales bacterium]
MTKNHRRFGRTCTCQPGETDDEMVYHSFANQAFFGVKPNGLVAVALPLNC